MRAWLLCGTLTTTLGCSAAATKPSAFALRRAAPAASATLDAPAPASAPASLERSFTGQPRPSLVVSNGFLIAQHVFVDWVHQAELAPARSQQFQLSVGTHTITCADSTDPDNHPATITETFEAGYAYAYTIKPTPN